MSVPDWPNTYGYNMFFFPWQDWVGGIFFEHSHRLVASGVGDAHRPSSPSGFVFRSASGCAGWALVVADLRSCWKACSAACAWC